jgi:hypothetical protein
LNAHRRVDPLGSQLGHGWTRNPFRAGKL